MIIQDVWYRQMPGLMVLGEEKMVLGRLLKKRQNAILLQIGGPNDARLTEITAASQVVFLDALFRTHHEKPYIQSKFEQLPIESDSIDTVLIIHALELSSHPKEVIAEVHRILKPGGKMIIACFNRWSMWNFLHLLGRKKVFPKTGRCYALSTIKNYVRALDYEINVQQTLCFRPPFRKQSALKQWLFLETLGQFLLPYCGAIVMVMATKKVVEMKPLIDLEWMKQMGVTPQGVGL